MSLEESQKRISELREELSSSIAKRRVLQRGGDIPSLVSEYLPTEMGTQADIPVVENPPVQGSILSEYAKPTIGFVGLSLLGGFLTGVGRDVADLFLHSPNKNKIIIQDDRKKEDEKDKHPVIVNQIGLNVENIQRQTTSRPVQRRRK